MTMSVFGVFADAVTVPALQLLRFVAACIDYFVSTIFRSLSNMSKYNDMVGGAY